jgi:putative glycosyltransferase (TIGR04372 family)
MEVVMALALARIEHAAVAFVRPHPLVNPAALELESPQVPIVRLGRLAHAWWAFRWWHWRVQAIWERAWREFREAFLTEVARLLRNRATDQRLPNDLRRRLKWVKQRLPRVKGIQPISAGPYFLRQAIREPVPVRLRAEVLERASRQATALGIYPDARIVTVHAREPGYKRGHEVHEKAHRSPILRDDGTRNVRIETYLPAMDFLVSHGYTVVRLGDPTMHPIARAGVVDLALDPRRTPELDFFCLLKSEFLLAGESGPSVMTLLTNTPTLTMNATDPVSSFPIRRDWLFALKRVVDLKTDRVLTLQEMASPTSLEAVRDTNQFRFLSHTSQEVLEGVQEMIAFLAKPPLESVKQSAFREQVTATANELAKTLRYVRKWGPDDGFLGDGRIASFFVEKYWT